VHPEFDPKDIVTINLKYASTAKPLKLLAFAQLSSKVLYLAQSPMTIGQLQHTIATTLGVSKISESSVRDGLSFLQDERRVTESANRWELTSTARNDIGRDVEQSHIALARVLERHFPSSIEPLPLKNWFKESSARIFGQFGDKWVASVCRDTKHAASRMQPLTGLLKPVTNKYKLDAHKQILDSSC